MKRLVALAVTLPLWLALASPALAQDSEGGAAPDSLQLWLHRRSPDEPFRYYGFVDAVTRYFKAQVLRVEPDPEDVTRLILIGDESEARNALAAEVAALEDVLSGVPLELRERDEHIARMKAERARLQAQLGQAKAQMRAAEDQMGGGIVSTSRAWDQRTELDRGIGKLDQRLAAVNDEITRTEMGRIKAMQTGDLQDQLLTKQAELDALDDLESAPVDYYMVSHRPLLLVAASLAVVLLAVGLRLRSRPVGAAQRIAFCLALGLVTYTFASIAAAEQIQMGGRSFGTPWSFGLGVAVFMLVRTLSQGRRISGWWSPAIALGAVVAATAAGLLQGDEGEAPLWLEAWGPVMDVGRFAVWIVVAYKLLDRALPAPLTILGLAGVGLGSSLVDGPTWAGVWNTVQLLLYAAVPAVAIVLNDMTSTIRHAPAQRPEQEPEAEPDWA